MHVISLVSTPSNIFLVNGTRVSETTLMFWMSYLSLRMDLVQEVTLKDAFHLVVFLVDSITLSYLLKEYPLEEGFSDDKS